jgi:hypothetical protein
MVSFSSALALSLSGGEMLVLAGHSILLGLQVRDIICFAALTAG